MGVLLSHPGRKTPAVGPAKCNNLGVGSVELGLDVANDVGIVGKRLVRREMLLEILGGQSAVTGSALPVETVLDSNEHGLGLHGVLTEDVLPAESVGAEGALAAKIDKDGIPGTAPKSGVEKVLLAPCADVALGEVVVTLGEPVDRVVVGNGAALNKKGVLAVLHELVVTETAGAVERKSGRQKNRYELIHWWWKKERKKKQTNNKK